MNLLSCRASLALPLILTLTLTLYAPAVSAREGAFLIATRSISEYTIVENKNFTITYQIFNIGNDTAVDLSFSEPAFPESHFTIYHGEPRLSFPSLAPGANITFNMTLKALEPGAYGGVVKGRLVKQVTEQHHAIVSYKEAAGGQERSVLVAIEEPLIIESVQQFKKRTDKHFIEWGIYVIASFAFTLAPYLIYLSTQSALVADSSRKKKE